jgi:hypothetical protein
MFSTSVMGASTMELSTGQVGATGAYNCQVMADGAETTGSGNAVDVALDAIVPVRGFASAFDALNDMAVLDEFWCQVDEFAFRPECYPRRNKYFYGSNNCGTSNSSAQILNKGLLSARLQPREGSEYFIALVGIANSLMAEFGLKR